MESEAEDAELEYSREKQTRFKRQEMKTRFFLSINETGVTSLLFQNKPASVSTVQWY